MPFSPLPVSVKSKSIEQALSVIRQDQEYYASSSQFQLRKLFGMTVKQDVLQGFVQTIKDKVDEADSQQLMEIARFARSGNNALFPKISLYTAFQCISLAILRAPTHESQLKYQQFLQQFLNNAKLPTKNVPGDLLDIINSRGIEEKQGSVEAMESMEASIASLRRKFDIILSKIEYDDISSYKSAGKGESVEDKGLMKELGARLMSIYIISLAKYRRNSAEYIAREAADKTCHGNDLFLKLCNISFIMETQFNASINSMYLIPLDAYQEKVKKEMPEEFKEEEAKNASFAEGFVSSKDAQINEQKIVLSSDKDSTMIGGFIPQNQGGDDSDEYPINPNELKEAFSHISNNPDRVFGVISRGGAVNFSDDPTIRTYRKEVLGNTPLYNHFYAQNYRAIDDVLLASEELVALQADLLERSQKVQTILRGISTPNEDGSTTFSLGLDGKSVEQTKYLSQVTLGALKNANDHELHCNLSAFFEGPSSIQVILNLNQIRDNLELINNGKNKVIYTMAALAQLKIAVRPSAQMQAMGITEVKAPADFQWIEPGQVLFFDDEIDNVVYAKLCGFQAFIADSSYVKEKIKKHGVSEARALNLPEGSPGRVIAEELRDLLIDPNDSNTYLEAMLNPQKYVYIMNSDMIAPAPVSSSSSLAVPNSNLFFQSPSPFPASSSSSPSPAANEDENRGLSPKSNG